MIIRSVSIACYNHVHAAYARYHHHLYDTNELATVDPNRGPDSAV